MQVILLEKILRLGEVGDQVNVKSGYARNFLVPKEKAVLATKENIEFFNQRNAELKEKAQNIIELAKKRADQLSSLINIQIIAKASAEGKLFGSIGVRAVAEAITKAGMLVSKSEVRLPNGVIRNIGYHEVNFIFHNKVHAKLIINVVAE